MKFWGCTLKSQQIYQPKPAESVEFVFGLQLLTVLGLFSFPAVFPLPSGSVYPEKKKKGKRLVKSKGAFTQKKVLQLAM